MPASTAAATRRRESRDGRASDKFAIKLHYGQTLAWQARVAGYRIISVFAGTGSGKALALDTPIPTPDGWTTMGALCAGDTVFDEQGQPCRVVDATPVMLGRDCYDVAFSDGTVITADADHLWWTWTHAARKGAARRITRAAKRRLSPQTMPSALPAVVTTAQMRATLRLGARANRSIPLAQPLQCPERPLPIDPYALGVWLGDGTATDAVVTTVDPEMLAEVERAGYAVTLASERREGFAPQYRIGGAARIQDPATGRWTVNGSLRSALAALGLLGNKHVPAIYFRASAAQRLALLQGLMDTDGTVDVGGSCEFVGVDEGLARAVYDLAASLGLKPTFHQDRARLNGVDFGPRYRVAFTPHIIVFRLPRKRERQRPESVRATQHHRYVVDVRERPSVPVRCIAVDSPNHLYLASRACIPTHNTWYGPRHFYHYFQQPGGLERTYLFTEPTYRMLARVMLPEVERFLEPFGVGKMNRSDMVYNFYAGGRILFGSVDNPNSLQGAHIDGGIWADEIGLYAEEAWDVLYQRGALYKAPHLNTSTPYTLPWVERRLAKPASDPTTARTYRLIQFPSYYNPAYPLDEYFALKRLWPADKFDRLMRGLFTRIGGLMFAEFAESRNLAIIYPIEDTTGAGRRLLFFKHPAEGAREVELVRVKAAQDWGWSPDPGCQLLAGVDGMGRVYVFEEDYDTEVPVTLAPGQRDQETWTDRALARLTRWGLDGGLYCDPSMPGYIAGMSAAGLPAVKATNNVEYGTDLVNIAFKQRTDGSCGLYIAQNACPNLIRTIGSYVRAKQPGGDGYLNKPAPRQEDHAEDALRYLIAEDAKPPETGGVVGLPPIIRGAARGSGNGRNGRDRRR